MSTAKEMVPEVYEDLRRVAHRRMTQEREGHTFSTTDLVHEAYLRLAGVDGIEGRAHFLALAARVMRNILVDHALARKAEKRGGGGVRVELVEGAMATPAPAVDLVVLDGAMRRLEELDPRQCQVVECRVFAGMSVDETAQALSVSPASVKRDWTLARSWLNRELAA
jgi:RNA polymerase sigma factor (TIGR02999 family)